jgi:hypothetical protein
MRHLTLLAVCLALGSAARAQAPAAEKLIAAYCQPGQGCEACRTPYTHQQAIDLGVVREYHGNGVLVVSREADGKWRSASRAQATVEALGQEFGRPGAPAAVTFQASCAARPPLPGSLKPRAGEWQITSESRQSDACPASVRELAGGATGTLRDRLQFPEPFLGEIPHLTPAMMQTGPNQFEGIAIAGEVHAWLLMVVRSEDEFLLSMTLTEQGELDPACDASVTQTFKRIGD